MLEDDTILPAWTAALISALAIVLWTGLSAAGPADHGHEQGPMPGPGPRQGHVHVQVPAAYAAAHIPVRVWTDPRLLGRGKDIFLARCAICHGERGDGKGPGAVGLPLRPTDLTDAPMVAMMPGNYWFWRVSEGGQVEPFRSQGSAMPAWKSDLSIADRWAVIAYAHTLSGHVGPHTRGEHGEAAGGHGHAGQMEHGHGH